MGSNATTQFAAIHGTLMLAVSLDPQEIGVRVAAARKRKGWTQLRFAMEANVSPSTVARWEAGKLPPVRELMRIADVLEVDVNEFVEPEVSGQGPHLEAMIERLIELLEAEVASRTPPAKPAARVSGRRA